MGNKMGKDTENRSLLLENEKISTQVGMATDKKQDKISSQVSDKEVVKRSQVQESTQIIMLDKISSQDSDKEVVNRSRVQESTQIIMLLCVSFSNKLGNSMLLGQRNRISVLENNKISSKVGINEQEELINGQEENMKNNVSELQTKAGSLANERELLDQKNRELSTEVIFLKSRLNEYNAKLAHLKDQMEQNESVLEKYRT